MDLNRISDLARPSSRAELPGWEDGDAWLAGGTWLLSEPQPDLRRLIDLGALNWPAIRIDAEGLRLAATCTISQLDGAALPEDWTAAPLIGQCCRAFLASFKIWNTATFGGNLCMALPAGPMIALAVALDGTATIWTADGGERRIAVTDFVIGPQQTALSSGELLREISIPVAALERLTAFRQISLNPLGRSAALLIGTASPRDGDFVLTIAAATARPYRLPFARAPTAGELRDRIAADIPASAYFDDIHGAPDWRHHLTLRFAEEIRAELSGAAAP